VYRVLRRAATWGALVTTACSGSAVHTDAPPLPRDAAPSDVAIPCQWRGTVCPQLIVRQVAVHRFALDAGTIFLSVLNDRICHAPKSGGPSETLATVEHAPSQLLLSGERLYYTTPSASGQSNAGIYAMPKSGGAPTTLASGLDGAVIAVDGTSLYYSERIQNRIYRVALDVTDGASRSEVLLDAPFPVVQTVDAGFLYWTDFGGGSYAFQRISLPSGTPQIVFIEQDRGLVAPVLVGDDVYWFGSLGGKLQRASKSGGPAELIYQGQGSDVVRFARLAIAAGFAYVYDSNHTLYRVSLKTRMRETLVEDVDLLDLAADEDAVYFAEGQYGIFRLRH
jgi:hypothetical protein